VARLRDDCTEAKEQLSADVDATIPVLIPGHAARDIRITRAEFEGLVRPVLADTIGCVERSLATAGVTADQLHAVLLVGGSSRVPLVGQLVAAGLGRPVAVDADPKLSVAQGAALAAEAAADAAAPPTEAVPVVAPPAEPAPPPAEPPPPARTGSGSSGGRRGPILVAVAVIAIAAIVGGFLLFGGDDDGGEDDVSSGGSTTTTADPETTTTTAGGGGTTTTLASPFPEDGTPAVRLTTVDLVDGNFEVGFATNFPMSPAEDQFGPEPHIHLFWNSDDPATAGANGDPEPCNCWFAYGGPSPAVDPTILSEAGRPDGATAICALVATPNREGVTPHQIADVDSDGSPNPDSGDCIDVP
jgi:hypothetical protein